MATFNLNLSFYFSTTLMWLLVDFFIDEKYIRDNYILQSRLIMRSCLILTVTKPPPTDRTALPPDQSLSTASGSGSGVLRNDGYKVSWCKQVVSI